MPIELPRPPQERIIARPVSPPRLRPVLGQENFGGGEAAAAPLREVSRGAAMLQDQVVRAQIEADQLRLSEEKRAADEWWIRTLTDPQTGAVNRRGKAAFGVTGELLGDWDKFVQERSKGLESDRQRRHYRLSADARRVEILQWGNRHEREQRVVFEEAEFQAGVESAKERASVSPETLETELPWVRQRVQERVNELGLGPEAARQEIQKHETDLHARVIQGMLGKGQYGPARAYFDRWRERMDPDVRGKVLQAVEEGDFRIQSQQEADRIMALDLTDRERMAEARKLDGRLRDLTVDRVQARIREEAAFRAQEQDEAFERGAQAIEAAARGEFPGAVAVTGTAAVPADDWARLSVRQRHALDRLANPERQTDDRKWVEFLFMDREELASLSPAEYTELVSHFSDADRAKADTRLKAARDAREGGDAADRFTSLKSDQEMLLEQMQIYGKTRFVGETPRTVDEIRERLKKEPDGQTAKAFRQLWDAWDQARAAFHARTGKNPDDKENLRLLREVMRPQIRVRVPDPDDPEQRFFRLTPEEQAKASVPFENIPPADLDRIRVHLGGRIPEDEAGRELVEELYMAVLLKDQDRYLRVLRSAREGR